MARKGSPAEYAEVVSSMPPEEGGRPIKEHRVREWCREGLLQGVDQDPLTRRWRIRLDQKPPTAHLDKMTVRREDGYSPGEWAKKLGVHRTLVYGWLRRGEVEGAEKLNTGWFIPKGTRDPRKQKRHRPKPGDNQDGFERYKRYSRQA